MQHTDTASHGAPNRLIHAKSPYLLQHAYNPVDWREWNAESLAEAVERNCPILLSIGYSACHWCHVMERESFADVTIASIMNASFVCIKVDREERPDLDHVYMTALQRMTGQGGWPLTMFLTPQGEPFYGGTYFPPEDRGRMPGFVRVLRSVHTAWRDREADLRSTGAQMQQELTVMMEVPAATSVQETSILAGINVLIAEFDHQHGGFGGAPKFPPAMMLSGLLRTYDRTHNEELRNMVTTTLVEMASGGIYDHVGGGFHRYSVDARWEIPHFEKMLYDNGLLLRTYSEAHICAPQARYATVIAETCAWLIDEMRHTGGAFFAALDADSDGHEGAFYRWSEADLVEICEARAPWLRAYFRVDGPANFEGYYVLQAVTDAHAFATARGIDLADMHAMVATTRAHFARVRAQRNRPQCDDKIIASWNGLAITGLAWAGRALHNTTWLTVAEEALAAIRATLYEDGVLYRIWRNGARGPLPGFLEDYANMAEAALTVGMITGQRQWSDWGFELLQSALRLFYDNQTHRFYDTSVTHDALIVRPVERSDNATPSGIATMLEVLYAYADLYQEPYFAHIAEQVLGAYTALIQRWPQGFGKIWSVYERHLTPSCEIVRAGPAGELWPWIWHHAPLHAVFVVAEAYPELILCQNKTAIALRETLYYCTDGRCLAPITATDQPAAMQIARGNSSESQ